jgi:hypothetical protein
VFLGVQILLSRLFYKVKMSGRFWPNAHVHLYECRPENLATLNCILIWGKFPIWGKNDISVGIFVRFLWIFSQVSFKYLGNFKIPDEVNGEFMDFLWGISKKKSGNSADNLPSNNGNNPFPSPSSDVINLRNRKNDLEDRILHDETRPNDDFKGAITTHSNVS